MTPFFLLLSLLGCGPSGVDGWFVVLEGVVSTLDGTMLEDASVDVYASDGTRIATVATDSAGHWKLPILGTALLGNEVVVDAQADGFAPGRAWYDVDLQSPDVHGLTAGPGQTFSAVPRRLAALRLAPEADRALALGLLLDAVTAAPVPGMALSVQRGWNTPLGEPAVTTAETDGTGEFSFVVDIPGIYTVSVNEAQGYAYTRFPVWATYEGYRSVGLIVPPPEPGQLRAAMIWNGQSQDLDLHFGAFRPDGRVTVDGNRFHLWSGEPEFVGEGEVQAEMTRVAADGQGPESLAVWEQPSGDPMTLTVVDQAHLQEDGAQALASSAAQVQVWYGEDIPRYYVISPDMEGTWWRPVELTVTAVSYVVETFGSGIEPRNDALF